MKKLSLVVLTLLITFILFVSFSPDSISRYLDLYLEDIVFLTQEHLVMVALSAGGAVVTGVALGILLNRRAMLRFSEPVMQVLNVGTAIPTLAVLALSMSFFGIGFKPALFALWLAALLPIVRNTYTGLRAVSPFLLEAANGMGMRPLHILISVELPNALFVMFAGIRTAVAINVGTVPLAFLIGGGGLGELIFTGIDMNDMEMMLSGAVTVAVLAVLIDFVIGRIQYWIVPYGINPLR